MADLVLTALRRNAKVVMTALSVAPAWQQVLSRNPQRYLIQFASDPTNQLVWTLSEAAPTTFAMPLGANAPLMTISEDIHGGIVTYPLWMASSPGTSNVVMLTASYQIEELAIYQELLYEFISRRKSPGAYP